MNTLQGPSPGYLSCKVSIEPHINIFSAINRRKIPALNANITATQRKALQKGYNDLK